MMGTKIRSFAPLPRDVSLEELVPNDNFYRRKSDLFLSKTDLEASPMKRKGTNHTHLGYQAHCVVDGGKARIVLGVLVAPFEITENKPILDMLWRAVLRWES